MADRKILPATFKPGHYDLRITDLEFSDWSYKGSVTITGELTEATTQVTLNTLELRITKATLNDAVSTSFADNVKSQRTTISFKDSIPAGKDAVLAIDFVGEMNHDMAGFYRSQYKPVVPAAASVPRDDDFHYMLSTQFESCDARRAFPCFDEPNLKATFDFAIEIPDDQVALSNMPQKSSVPTKEGRKLVSFDRTPIMSTYLLAWAVGDFEYVEAFTDREYDGKKLPVRVYTTKGLKEQGRWALAHAPKIIDYFSQKFEIDYPLPKSDILAVHEFTHGAMENWGLVTYRMTAILFDEERSEARFRDRIAYVVAHELAHQWFGNLVTMDWWDELWLNEGFATWAGYLATDYLHPEWNVWAQVVHESMESAFALDSIRASHPIQVPVADALDVNQVFDHISYRKGCSIIRMLANHLGSDTFLKGVAIYLKKNQYSNAQTTALWEGLSEASGIDVNALMESWIKKIGFPVVTVAEEPEQISVKQTRFLSTGDVKPEDDTTTWWVPLALEGKKGTDGVASIALTDKEDTIRDIDTDFYKINSDATGFYRINYPPARLNTLATQLDKLTTLDKIFIVGSAADLAFSGDGTTPALLSFVQGLHDEKEYRVLSQALDSIGSVKSIFGGDETIKAGLERFTLKLIETPLKELGWEFPAGEDYNRSLLRKRLILTAVVNGHKEVNEEATRRFNAYKADAAANPVHPTLRTPIYRAALAADPEATVSFLKNEWASTAAVDGKEVCLTVLGHTPSEELITSTVLPFLFNLSPPAPASESVPAGDMHWLSLSLSGSRAGRPLQWKFVQENWAQIEKKVGGNPIVLDRFVKVALQKFSDFDTLKEIEKFFSDKDTSSFDRTLGTVKDMIKGRATYRERDAAVLKEWLEANGYTKAE